MPFNGRRRPTGRFFFFPFVAILFVLIMGGLVMWLWNAILPAVVHVSPLTYWQAVGLLVLSRILFGNFRGGPPRGRGPWRGSQAWREKWINMTPEERQKFREEWQRRCSPGKKQEGEQSA